MKKSKGIKIKNYNKIFSSESRRKKRIIKNVIVYTVIIAVLVFIGYSISDPLSHLLKGEKTPVKQKETSSQISEKQAGTSSVKTQSEAAIKNTELKIACLSRDIACDKTKLEKTADDLKAKGYNAVSVELKDTYGNVYYNTALESVIKVGAKKETGLVNLSDFVSAVKAKGLVPVAEINAFKDVLGTKDPAAKIQYAGHEGWSWLDGKSGVGKPWLNPYSDSARLYVESIACELVDNGFEHVMVSSIMFPEVRTTSVANFGEKAANLSKGDALKEFTSSLKTKLNAKKAKLLVCYDAKKALNANNNEYGGKNPTTFYADAFVPTLSAELFEGTLTVGEQKLENAKQNLSDATLLVVNSLKALNSKATFVPRILLGTDKSSLTAEQIEIQKKVFESQKLGGYCVYSANSQY